MTPDPNFGFEQVAMELIRGVVDIVASCPGMADDRRSIKQQTVVHEVMGFQPRDPLEVMLAGQCVIYDNILRDAARDLLRGADEPIKVRARTATLAAGRMFLATFGVLRRMQGRTAKAVAGRAGAGQAQSSGAAAGGSSPPPLATTPTDAGTPMAAGPSVVWTPSGEARPVAEAQPLAGTQPLAETQPLAGTKPLAGRPLAGTPPTTVTARPRFVCQRVHQPRRVEPGHVPRFGAGFRLPEPPGQASFHPPLPGGVPWTQDVPMREGRGMELPRRRPEVAHQAGPPRERGPIGG